MPIYPITVEPLRKGKVMQGNYSDVRGRHVVSSTGEREHLSTIHRVEDYVMKRFDQRGRMR